MKEDEIEKENGRDEEKKKEDWIEGLQKNTREKNLYEQKSKAQR